jgi:serine/threonine-protein kinase
MSEEAATKPPEETKPPLTVGDVIADKYRVDEIVGQGAMGYVFAAEHTHLGHRVALKVLRAGALEHRESVERFLREGRIVARIQSEHVARVSDVGTLKSGVPYLVMEFLEGSDLSKILKARGEPLSLADTVDFTLQVCEALAHAHVLGVVHRDLKPANLYVTQRLDGTPLLKVLDFGISKASTYGDGQDELTMTAALMGTPRYMSPEQIHDSRLVDSRTDIWALGTIIYEMLTLERCFQAPSVAMTCVKILQQDPPALSQLRPDLPPQVEEVIARCLRKEPTERWSNVGELAEAIAPFGAPDAPQFAARIHRIVTTPPDLKNSGPRAVLGATGSFSAATTGSFHAVSTTGSNPGLRITGPNSSPGLMSASPSASPSPESRSYSGAIARASTASVPHDPAQPKKGRGLVLGGLALIAVVVGIVIFTHNAGKDAGTTSASGGSTQTAKPTASATTTGSTPASATNTAAATTTATAPPTTTESATATATASATTTAPTTKKWTAPTSKPTTTATASTAAPTTTTPPKPTGGDSVLDDRQ